jgi:hypothetical protein
MDEKTRTSLANLHAGLGIPADLLVGKQATK